MLRNDYEDESLLFYRANHIMLTFHLTVTGNNDLSSVLGRLCHMGRVD